MTDFAALIRVMGAAGAPAEAIALAVEAIEAASASQRAAARERKRRQRARGLDDDDVAGQGVTVTGQANDDPSPGRSLASPDPSTPPNPPTRHPQPKRARRLHDDWVPAPLPADDAAMIAAWPAGMLERELARFRDHWRATGGARARKLDWNAAWRNWLREADDERPRPRENKPRDTGGRPPGEPASAMVRAGLARLRHAGGA